MSWYNLQYNTAIIAYWWALSQADLYVYEKNSWKNNYDILNNPNANVFLNILYDYKM